MDGEVRGSATLMITPDEIASSVINRNSSERHVPTFRNSPYRYRIDLFLSRLAATPETAQESRLSRNESMSGILRTSRLPSCGGWGITVHCASYRANRGR